MMACYLQLQRLMGQQSLAGFMGLHVNIDAVKRDNDAKDGYRKQGCIIREGDKMTHEEKLELIKLNRKQYRLPRKYLA